MNVALLQVVCAAAAEIISEDASNAQVRMSMGSSRWAMAGVYVISEAPNASRIGLS